MSTATGASPRRRSKARASASACSTRRWQRARDGALRRRAARSRWRPNRTAAQHVFAGRAPLTPTECNERLAALHAHCLQHYPGLRATRLLIGDEHHTKQLRTERRRRFARQHPARVLRHRARRRGRDRRADRGRPAAISCKGSLADLDWSLDTLAPLLARAHEHLQAKRHAVAARGGQQTVVLAPELAGMLAHEAMGHPCEADAVLGGAVTASLAGQPVASELVSMLDIAHTWNGEEAMAPVYVDDEGTPGARRGDDRQAAGSPASCTAARPRRGSARRRPATPAPTTRTTSRWCACATP